MLLMYLFLVVVVNVFVDVVNVFVNVVVINVVVVEERCFVVTVLLLFCGFWHLVIEILACTRFC